MTFIKRISLILLVAGLCGVMSGSIISWAEAASNQLDIPAPAPAVGEPPGLSLLLDEPYLYLPIVSGSPPWQSPFGVEPFSLLVQGGLNYTRTLELGTGWIRLGTHVRWRQLQPNEGDPIQWGVLAGFENQLLALKKAGIRPVVTITDSPRWATIIPSSCAAVRGDKFAAFADFMRQLVLRYKEPEFNVHDWEIGNEPDVDPGLVGVDNVFGCWGDYAAPYYGGQHYGEMLKVVGQAIKQADPRARVWVGGLLLDRPDTPPNPTCSITGKCRPELFLEGILLSGAASYFDVLAYHSYPPYTNLKVDHENALVNSSWYSWGGGIIGKARFLRQAQQTYGVNKPLYLNETSLMYYPSQIFPTPGPDFYQMQADYLSRSFVRALGENISGMVWYTLEGPGWRYTGLMNSGVPNPAFIAYEQLTNQLKYSRYIGPLDYGSEIEAYAFWAPLKRVQVLWTKSDQTLSLVIPGHKFISAYDRDGNLITPLPAGADYQISVGFSPIYINYSP